MEQNNKYIEDLLEKFFEGLTSNKEEQELYKFFSEDNVIPDSLVKYRPMFQYFDTNMECELETIFGGEDEAIVDVVKENDTNTLLKKRIIAILIVAASFLLLFLINPFDKSSDFNPYEGSYVKKDGVIISDIEEVEEEQMRIELLVEQKLASLDNPFLKAKEKLEEYEDLTEQLNQVTRTLQ